MAKRQVAVCGLRDNGKTNLAMEVADTVPPNEVLVYDPNGQWAESDYRAYVPQRPQSLAEFEDFVQSIVLHAQPRLFVVDEAHLILPRGQRPLPDGLMELRARGRHYGIAVLYVVHRPVDVSPSVRELLDYWFVLKIPGEASTEYLNKMRKGLGDAALKLPKYHFIVYDVNEGGYWVHKPVKDHELG